MRIRTVVVAVSSVLALFISVQPASAQDKKPEFAIGYNFLRELETGGANVPSGWGASVAAPMGQGMLKVVGDISGHYKNGGRLHFFQGGVEFAGKNPTATPFFRALAGLGVSSGGGSSDSAFVFTPEFGVKTKGSGRVGGQFAVGFPIVRDSGDTFKHLRLFLGITVQ